MINYKLYLIRHGITKGNLEGRYIGKTDLPLCDEGYAAIASFSSNNLYPNVGKIYSSPMKRCLETADIIYPDRYIKVIDDLRECDFGEFENKTQIELQHLPEYTEWIKGGYDATPPSGESYGDFALRCVSGLDAIFQDMMRDKVTSAAAITHSGVIMHLLAGYGLPKGKPADFALNQGEGFEIQLSTFLWTKGTAFEITGRIF